MFDEIFDVLIIGGGHNGLIAACYLGRAGLKVAIVERSTEVGGATVSQRIFPDFDVQLSRYSYLVSLLPDKIIQDLELTFRTISRPVSSFTPERADGVDTGLLVSSPLESSDSDSFSRVTGGDVDFTAWRSFYADLFDMAQVIAPTLLQKLPTRTELRMQVNHPIWNEIFEVPLGEVIEKRFKSDLVRGVVLTDGLIGTFSSAHSFVANTCFAYHLIGNGTGEWKVPVGGMGRLSSELENQARVNGVEIFTSQTVNRVRSQSDHYLLETHTGREFGGKYLLANCAPQTLASLIGDVPPDSLDGSQVKINMLVKKLPKLRSGIDPEIAFAGTFHIDERYSDLELAYQRGSHGIIPEVIPAEMYCHTLTDPSILGEDLRAAGYHTLTIFALHTPAFLFDGKNEESKRIVQERVLRQLNRYLVDPIETCFATALDGSACIETMSPLDLERELGMPRGNIFHKNLSLPFREDGEPSGWGVETPFPNLFLCGAGAIRGGGVSGIPGHNAAAAVMESLNIS